MACKQAWISFHDVDTKTPFIGDFTTSTVSPISVSAPTSPTICCGFKTVQSRKTKIGIKNDARTFLYFFSYFLFFSFLSQKKQHQFLIAYFQKHTYGLSIVLDLSHNQSTFGVIVAVVYPQCSKRFSVMKLQEVTV